MLLWKSKIELIPVGREIMVQLLSQVAEQVVQPGQGFSARGQPLEEPGDFWGAVVTICLGTEIGWQSPTSGGQGREQSVIGAILLGFYVGEVDSLIQRIKWEPKSGF